MIACLVPYAILHFAIIAQYTHTLCNIYITRHHDSMGTIFPHRISIRFT